MLPNFSKSEKFIYYRLVGFVFVKVTRDYMRLLIKSRLAIDQHETTVAIFLDLSEAFDTIDHEIFFNKLEHYDIRDAAPQWIKSFFSYRYQFVQFNQKCSAMQTLQCGALVPFLALYFSYFT